MEFVEPRSAAMLLSGELGAAVLNVLMLAAERICTIDNLARELRLSPGSEIKVPS